MIRHFLAILLAGNLLLFAANASAQPSRADIEAARARFAAARSGKPDDSGKSDEPSKSDDSKKSEEKDKDADENSSEAVDRPDKPDFKVDPSELEVKPIDGKVQFNFHGQPWQGVLEWLAAISGLSLDWQELPGDYLNLRTQRAYTLDEARDLINQHLLARGYTMLRHGEVLRVVNLDKLDPALVPHVEPAELDERDKHEFVQTTFALDWLPAATAEQELKPLLSPHGKLTKLTTTNRLHAIDVVTNLIAIRDLLAEEQSGEGQERLVKSFQLKYARAETVKSSLEDLLGLEQSGGSSGGDRDSRQMQMMRQMQEQMQQMQRRGNDGPKPQSEEQKASIIANHRENAIIATAPPETMQIIEQTVKLLDAAPESATSFESQLRRIKAYRLNEIDAETLTETLLDLGGFDPKTTITPDEDNSAIIVKGPIADHFVVQEVIEKLDGAVREFKVIPLRRLPADYVAGTIRFMMGSAEEEEDNNDSYRWWDNDNDDEKETTAGQFRVDADVAGNRLLLYANPTEIEEIHNLLIQLGEIRPRDGDRSTVRVLDLSDDRAAEFLRLLEANWGADESHPLKIDPELLRDPAPSDEGEDVNEDANEEESAKPNADPVTPITVPTEPAAPATTSSRDNPSGAILAQAGAAHLMLQDELVPTESTPPPNAAEDPAGIEPESPEDSSSKPKPVTIRRGPDGKLIVHSEDPRMLNIVEDLMYELAPPPKNYEVFKLEYPTTYMYDVIYNLEMYFEVGMFAEDEDDGDSSPFFFRWDDDQSEKETPLRLSERKELKFIPDPYTRTIIVQGASPEQLETIEELIKIYDQPQSQNSGDLRVTKIFSIEHAKAETIATAIKDVYRDLLSANDRAFQSRGGERREGQRPMAERSYTYVYGGGDDNRSEPEEPIKFKGLLSIGVDEESNTLVISAAQALMGSIEILIKELDTAAKQQEAVSVVRTGPGGVPSGLSTKLKEIFGEKIKIIGTENTETPTTEKKPVMAP